MKSVLKKEKVRLKSKMKPRLQAESVGVIQDDLKKGREKGWIFQIFVEEDQ